MLKSTATFPALHYLHLIDFLIIATAAAVQSKDYNVVTSASRDTISSRGLAAENVTSSFSIRNVTSSDRGLDESVTSSGRWLAGKNRHSMMQLSSDWRLADKTKGTILMSSDRELANGDMTSFFDRFISSLVERKDEEDSLDYGSRNRRTSGDAYTDQVESSTESTMFQESPTFQALTDPRCPAQARPCSESRLPDLCYNGGTCCETITTGQQFCGCTNEFAPPYCQEYDLNFALLHEQTDVERDHTSVTIAVTLLSVFILALIVTVLIIVIVRHQRRTRRRYAVEHPRHSEQTLQSFQYPTDGGVLNTVAVSDVTVAVSDVTEDVINETETET